MTRGRSLPRRRGPLQSPRLARVCPLCYGTSGVFLETPESDFMSPEQETGFVIRDRRGARAEESEHPPQAAPASQAAQPAAPSRTAGGEEVRGAHPQMPVTFASFVFSMGTSALMLMGESLDPRQSPVPVNLAQAKEIIDILSILEAKTKGNLTGEEQSVLTEMLYALRMKFVDLTSGKPATPAP